MVQPSSIGSIVYTDHDVRVHGNAAVLTASLVLYGQFHGIDPTEQRRQVNVTGPCRQMFAFVTEQGRWKLFAQSSTPNRLPGAAPVRSPGL